MVSSANSPLIDALLAVRAWYEAREAFWTHRTDQAVQLRELRRQVRLNRAVARPPISCWTLPARWARS
jgi:hypothetical protein